MAAPRPHLGASHCALRLARNLVDCAVKRNDIALVLASNYDHVSVVIHVG